MAVYMTLQDVDITEEALQKLTFDLMRTLDDEIDADASLPVESAGQGAKGDPVTIGQIVLTALTSGTVVALFGVLKAYFERKPSLEINFQRPDGEKLTLKATQLSSSQLDQSIALARDFFEVNSV